MQSNQKLIAFFILLIWCFCFDTSIAQVISAPEIDTPLTSSKTYFYNGDIIVPFSSGHVGVTNNAEVNIFSTSEINLLPGFSASIDSGCTELLVGIRNCPEIFILKQIDHITCNGKADGAIRLKCIGGSAPYLFNWSPSNKITSTLTKLVAGTYFVTVTDQSGCTVSDSISIFEPPPFYTEVYTTPSSCHEASGSVTISAFGGVGNYKYFWEHDGGSQSNRSELSAGVYEILVMDSNKCQSNAEASISDADGPEASVEILEQVTCHGFNTGRIRVLKSATFPEPVIPCGGLPNRLAAGSYPILQEDTNGCITMLQVTIDEPDPLSINFFKTSPTCGNNDGKLEASIIGGMEPYSFSWNYLSTDSILNNVSSGIYSLSVADANGCSISRAVFLPDSGSFGLQIAKTDVHCSREQDGQISVSVIGGTPPFNYRWFDSTNEIGGNENIINSLSVGLYTILITDNMGCKNVDSVFISEPEIFDLRLETMNPSYDSTFDGSISVFLTGGVPPYNIQWSNQEDKFNLNSCDSGSYNYIITDQNECELEGSVQLRSSSAIQASSQNPCVINPRLLPSYSNIQGSCACNPCSTCTELDIVVDFGAIPNDNLSDEESFEWASDFIKNVYCTTGVKLKIPPGKYIVGRQEFMGTGLNYRLGYNPIMFCECENITIEGQIDPVTNERPLIQFESCMRYGAFDPLSNYRYLNNPHASPYFGSLNNSNRAFAADVGLMIFLERCRNFSIRNLDLNGNIDNLTIGGYFATDQAGINLPNGGIRIDGCESIEIENCSANYFGQDGLLIRDDGFGRSPSNMDIRILNSQFNHNCRDGFHWNGGSTIFAKGCEFNYNGFGPWGGTRNQGGIEMEVDGPTANADIRNGQFIDCDIKFNKGQSLISSGGVLYPWKFENFLFKRCTIVSEADGYSTLIDNPNMTFQCCKIVGQVGTAYDAYGRSLSENLHTKFLSCEFNEEYFDPVTNSMKAFTKNAGNCSNGTIGIAMKMVSLQQKSLVLFNGCKFNAARFNNWARLYGIIGNDITVKNCYFYKERGDDREPTIGNNPYYGYNKSLLFLRNVDLTQNNSYHVPHSGNNCTCDYNTPNSTHPLDCWFANGCSFQHVLGNVKLPKTDGELYCDQGGPFYDPHYCDGFKIPDSYTDALHVDGNNLPCTITPYQNPIFTLPSISIYPYVPAGQDGPPFTLIPVLENCLSQPRVAKSSNSSKLNSKFLVYPVPASDWVHVINEEIGKNIYIYDVLGKMVLSKLIESEDQLLNLNSIPSGVYYMKLSNGNNVLKIIRAHQAN